MPTVAADDRRRPGVGGHRRTGKSATSFALGFWIEAHAVREDAWKTCEEVAHGSQKT